MKNFSIFLLVLLIISFAMISFAAEKNEGKKKYSFLLEEVDEQDQETDDEDMLSGELLEWYEKAKRRYDDKVYDDTIVYSNKVLERLPEYIPAIKLRGQAYIEKGKISKSKPEDKKTYEKHIHEFNNAVDSFSKIIKLDPDYMEAYFYRGQSYRYLDHYPFPAIEDLDKYLNHFKTKSNQYHIPEALFERGVANFQRGFIPESVLDLEDAITLIPDNKLYYSQLMKSHDVAESYKQARRFFTTMCDLYPDNALPWYFRGVATYKMGFEEDAKLCFQNALKIYPEFEDAKNMMSQLQ